MLIALFSSSFVIASCKVVDAKVTSLHRYTDGTLFINTNKQSDCGCSQKSRFAIKSEKVDSDDFTVSAVLTAYVSQKLITIVGLEGCRVHGNTPELSIFYLL